MIFNEPHYTDSNGLAVTGNRAFVLFMEYRRPPYEAYLFDINLDTGNARYINEETLGIKFKYGSFNFIGYDHQRNVIWFRLEDHSIETHGVYYYYFKYDVNTETFTKY